MNAAQISTVRETRVEAGRRDLNDHRDQECKRTVQTIHSVELEPDFIVFTRDLMHR